MKPHLDDGDIRVYAGDCLDVMAAMPAESVDAVVTDPPYGLEFMGREWDAFTPAAFQAWCEGWAREALLVLKPGGHLVAFGGTRTFHRLTCGLEDAGFEVRDCLSWLYGSGFPKSLDVSKAIDKAAGAEREVVGPGGRSGVACGAMAGDFAGEWSLTAPATPEAARWEGWGTALKPAWEPAVLARKPLAGTVAGNVVEHGTGALNIDGCRIGTTPDKPGTTPEPERAVRAFGPRMRVDYESNPGGRWPANVVLDEAAAGVLDEQAGEAGGGFGVRGGGHTPNTYGGGKGYAGTLTEVGQVVGYGDTGGPSRFFYTAKASTSERNNGHGPANTHPTVKPVDLMRWLVRLVTPPGGVVLDPFAGSGTTGLAARAEGHRAVLIEREPDYLQIIAGRLAQQSLFALTHEE